MPDDYGAGAHAAPPVPWSDEEAVTAQAVANGDPFALMDRLDEEAIRRELEGIDSTVLVYDVRIDGRQATGLSKTGVDECCNLLAHRGEVIREEALEWRREGEGKHAEAYFVVRAARFAVSKDGTEVKLDEVTGVKRQPLYYEQRSGAKAFNTFWFEHGSMKAARNARFRLLSSEIKAQVIAKAKDAGATRTVEDGGAAPAPRDAAPMTEKQEGLLRKLMKSHHLKEGEREQLSDWLDDGPSKKAASKAIDYWTDIIKGRKEQEDGPTAGEPKRTKNGPSDSPAAPAGPATTTGDGDDEPVPDKYEVIQEIEALFERVDKKKARVWRGVFDGLVENMAETPVEDFLRLRKELTDHLKGQGGD